MSKVYSFRLSEDNPREAQARRVIETWVEEGYSLRYVIVKALIEVQRRNSNLYDYDFLLEQLQNMINGQNRRTTVNKLESSLSNTFKAGIVESAKKGIQA